MRARPVVARYRRFYRRPPMPQQPQGAGGVYSLDIGAALFEVELAQMLADLGLPDSE